MATTLATQLGQAHRLAQANLAEAIARIVAAQWRVNVRAPGVGGDAFIAAATPVILQSSRQSSAVARQFYSTMRGIELPGADRVTLEIPELPDEQVVAGLVAAGFQQLSDAIEAGHTLEEALGIGETGAKGSAIRTMLEPGRRAIKDAHGQDERVLGYYRVTAGDDRVCFFCSMLASRGAVFSRESFDASDPRFIGPGKVKVHDNCRCGYVPFFRDQPALPDSVEQTYSQWIDVTADFSGHEKALAWRRYWEALSRGEGEDLARARAYRNAEDVARLRGATLAPTEEAA